VRQVSLPCHDFSASGNVRPADDPASAFVGGVLVPPDGEPPRPAALYFGYRASKPSALTLWITSRTRSGLVKVASAIVVTDMPCADNSTIWARRRVGIDPEPLRMIRSRRCASSSSISRTRTRSATRKA
jgi:hypothetical protein